jgi:4-amino-4-deoxy-L-arabinose transferase-like glycosyltransferase
VPPAAAVALDAGLAIFLLLVGGLLRWNGWDRQSFWIDEMSTLGRAMVPLRQIVPGVVAYDGHPPLYIFAVHFAYYTFHLGPIGSVRIPSLIFGTAVIPVVYLLARILAGRLAAVVASLLVVVSPIAVWYSRDGRMYALTWFFVMLSFLLLAQAARSRRWVWLAPYAASVALALYADVSAVIALAPQAVMIAWFFAVDREARQAWLRIGAGYVAGWLLFTPWLLVLPQQLPLLHPTFAGYEPGWLTAWRLVLDETGLIASYAMLWSLIVPAVVGVVILALYAAAIVIVLRHLRLAPLFGAVTLALTAGPAAMCGAFLLLNAPGVLTPRVMGIAAFGLALAAGGAVQFGWAALHPRLSSGPARLPSGVLAPAGLASAGLAAAGLALVAGTWLALHTVNSSGWVGESWRQVAPFLAAQVQPGDAIIYYPLGAKIMVDPYLQASSPPVRDGVGIWSSPHDTAESYFAGWTAGHDRVWFIYHAGGGIDMPVHDSWFATQGYTRVFGDPNQHCGVLLYVRAGTSATVSGQLPSPLCVL